MKRPVKRESGWINYVCYKLRPEYKMLPEAQRFQLAAFLVEILESPHDRVDVDVYCSVGFRADVDFFIRYQAPTADELQAIAIQVLKSGLGRYLDVTYNWTALHRPSPYQSGPEHDPDEEVPDTKYMVVYPFLKKREWFYLSHEDRGRMMKEHVAVGHKFPHIHINTAYSFGLGDQEWVIGFEMPNLEDFEKLVRVLRETEVSKYTLRDTPIVMGRAVKPHEALEMCGAL